MTFAVAASPQSWLTTMGNSLTEGRYFIKRSRQRFTVGLLHAITSTAATNSSAAVVTGKSNFDFNNVAVFCGSGFN